MSSSSKEYLNLAFVLCLTYKKARLKTARRESTTAEMNIYARKMNLHALQYT